MIMILFNLSIPPPNPRFAYSRSSPSLKPPPFPLLCLPSVAPPPPAPIRQELAEE